MKPEDYIGKKLIECPDGTKAVVSFMYRNDVEIRTVVNGIAHRCTIEGVPLDATSPADEYTVHRIITLGKHRPETLADEEPGVVWKDMYGDLYWRGDGAEVLISWQGGAPVHAADPASDYRIYPEWTRLGKITGIEIDGKVYRGEGGGE